MKARKIVIGAALVVIGLPVALVMIVAVSIYVLNRTNGTIVSMGEEREYLLYVPESYDRAKPTPLVISMHGAALWPAHQKNLSRWNNLADEQGFIVVYPAGGFGKLAKAWAVNSGASRMAEVRFISDLIDTLAAAYNIDSTRIYANGLSNGGAMVFVLSCKLSDRIAAVGMVAAAQELPWSWCTDNRPVPMIAFHGTADPLVPYDGGLSPTHLSPKSFPSVRVWTANWAQRNRCGPSPVESVVAPDVTRFEYTNCANDATVELYAVHGGGHTWPGGKPLPEWMVGPTSNGVDATRQTWAFFREHRLATK